MTKTKLKKTVATVGRVAKTIWEIPAIKSVLLTRLVRAGVGASGAAILVSVADALISK